MHCGERLNRAVDEPLVQSMPVVKVRADLQIPDRFGKVPHPPRLVGYDATGARSTLRLLPLARVDIVHHPHEQLDEDGTATVRFDARESKDVIKRKVAAARRRHGDVRAVAQHGSQPGGYRVSGVRLPLYGWPRVAAKVALGVGALVCEPAWLRSETAAHLREVLWADSGAGTTLALDMAPGEPPEDHAVRGALLPPEHLIWTSHTSDGRASVCLYLFAEWFLPVPLAFSPEEGKLVRDYAWLINPRRAKVTFEGPLPDVAARLEKRRPRVSAVLRQREQWLAQLERQADEIRREHRAERAAGRATTDS